MTLTLGESWPAWHPTARRGSLVVDGAATDVLVLMAPFQPSGVSQARALAARALVVRGAGVLRLLEIRAENNRIAWIYEGIDGVALSRLPEGVLGARAAAELVGRVASLMVEHGEHPGPESDDVLLAARAEVRVAGFVRPFAGAPAFRAPGRSDRDATVVYRLGALLAGLLGGAVHPGLDAPGHDDAVRRAVIGAMSAPGAALSEHYADWLRGMLHFDPDQRPPLSRVVPGLAELAEQTGGPSLAQICDRHFQRWLAEALGDDPDETTLPQRWEDHEVGPPEPTMEATTRRRALDEPILGDLTAEDDPTVDSEVGRVLDVERTPGSVVERGSIPVAVGPPPEVAARRPTLPSDLFEETVPGAPSDATTVVRAPAPTTPAWLRLVGVLLIGVAIGLAVWLVFG